MIEKIAVKYVQNTRTIEIADAAPGKVKNI